MKNNILKISITILLLYVNMANSQNVTIDYSTFSSSACNIFSAPVSINGISHQTTIGNPQYNSSNQAVVMIFDYFNGGGQKGTEFKIAYNIKQDYTYTIKVTGRNIGNYTTATGLKISFGDNGSSSVCNGISDITGTTTGTTLTGSLQFQSTTFNESVWYFNSGITSPSGYIRFTTYSDFIANPQQQAFEIKKIQIIEIPPPASFTLSPTSVPVTCNSSSPVNFTVTNVYNSLGTVTYNWNVGSGWSGSYNSSMSSITLTPTFYPPGTVSVTPIYNNVAQPTKTCIVNLSPFSSTASISGTQNICSGLATYNLAGLLAGETVSWILSNPALATIVSSSNTAATISFNGTGNGAQTLTATITNACNQTTVKQFVINTGSTMFSSSATITGSIAAACSGSRVFTISNLPVAQNVIWSVSNPSVATLSGASNTQVTLNLVGNGSVTLQARISNSCGQFSLKSVTLYAGTPRLTSFSCATQSKPFCSGIVTEIAAAVPNLPNVNDKITVSFSGMSVAEINTSSNWEWRRLNNRININGISSSCTIGCLSFGFTGVEVRARNSCGWSAWFPLNWELVEVPDPLMKKSDVKNAKLMVTPNPSNSSWNFTFPNTKITNITITDGLGKNVYTKNFTKNEAVIDCSTLQKGIYFAKVTTALGNETVRLLKN